MIDMFQQVVAPQRQAPLDLTLLPAESISKRRQMAEALLKSATDTSPVQHWTQAAARAMGGLTGALGAYTADRMGLQKAQAEAAKSAAAKAKSEAEQAQANELLMGLYPGSGAAPQDAAPAPEAFAQDRTAMARAMLQGSDPAAAAPAVMSSMQPPPQAPQPQASPQMQGMPSYNQLKAMLANPNTRAMGIEFLKEIQQRAMGPDAMGAAKLENAQLENELLRQKLAGGGADPVTQQRMQRLEEIGLDPNSAEGMAFIANGKLPAAAYQQLAQQQLKTRAAPKIAEGLNNLAAMANTYDDPSFANAVGPIQGSTPDGLLSSIPINTARLFGEVANKWEGGKTAPSEVRSNIQGSTEAIAAAIKPLIRAPGEGVWTDADQARLVSIVGDLANARTKDEFRRRLNAVRDRLQSSFGLDIPFDAMGGLPKQQAPIGGGFSIRKLD